MLISKTLISLKLQRTFSTLHKFAIHNNFVNITEHLNHQTLIPFTHSSLVDMPQFSRSKG